MQDDLFGADAPPPSTTPAAQSVRKSRGVQAVVPSEALLALAQAMPPQLRMGVSTWSYPGWDGLGWAGVGRCIRPRRALSQGADGTEPAPADAHGLCRPQLLAALERGAVRADGGAGA